MTLGVNLSVTEVMTEFCPSILGRSSHRSDQFRSAVELILHFAVTQEVLTLRQQVSDSQLTAAERQKLVEKAAQLAAENVALKAQVGQAALVT